MRRTRELPEKMTLRKLYQEMTHGGKGGIIPPSWQTPDSETIGAFAAAKTAKKKELATCQKVKRNHLSKARLF
jgi:hypothetical protein